MSPDEIHSFVRQASQEAAEQAVESVLIRLGIAAGDPIEMQKDMQHLRAMRLSTEDVKRKGVVTLLTIIIGALITALWVGLKDAVHRP